ncbi:MAG: CsgG/HfaB family protein [Pseudomonadota bacterium]
MARHVWRGLGVVLLAACTVEASAQLIAPLPQQAPLTPAQAGVPQVPGLAPQAGNLPNAPRSQAFANLPAVTIREFRSSVQEIGARGATDIFMTALIKTHKFRVLERARMNEGIAQEKALNQQGLTTGELGQSRYVGAAFMFEGTVSEASANSERSSFGLSLGGMGASRATSKDIVGIDVRVIDVESGVVLDAITVRKEIVNVETNAGGVSTALVNAFTRGRASALAPSDAMSSARQGGVDNALRLAIEEAVGEIALRFGAQEAR